MDNENIITKFERLKSTEGYNPENWIMHINEYLNLLNDIVESHEWYRDRFYNYMKELDDEFSMRVNKLRYMFEREFDEYIN